MAEIYHYSEEDELKAAWAVFERAYNRMVAKQDIGVKHPKIPPGAITASIAPDAQKIAGRTLDEWRDFARWDDCLEQMVPSDLRELLGVIDAQAVEIHHAEQSGMSLDSTTITVTPAQMDETIRIVRNSDFHGAKPAPAEDHPASVIEAQAAEIDNDRPQLADRLREPWGGSVHSRERRDAERAEAASVIEAQAVEIAALREALTKAADRFLEIDQAIFKDQQVIDRAGYFRDLALTGQDAARALVGEKL